MAEHTWAELADMAEKTPGSLGLIVAAICRQNHGASGGSAPVTIKDKPTKAAKPRAKK